MPTFFFGLLGKLQISREGSGEWDRTTYMTIPNGTTCGCCDALATYFAEHGEDFSHLQPVFACKTHKNYMYGWLRDAAHESECDSRDSLRYEYGE